jgi:hypothetical protein
MSNNTTIITFPPTINPINFVVFNPPVDTALRGVPDQVWDTLAGAIGIPFGILFAFLGAKLLRTSAFIFGAVGGGLIASAILAMIGNVPANVWLGVVITAAVVAGCVTWKVVRLARFFAVIALGATTAGIIVQYVFSSTAIPSWAIYLILALSIICAALIAYKAYKFCMILATSFLGSFVFLLSVTRLARGEVSLAGMWGNSDVLQSCVTMNCWGPFIGAAILFILSFTYQVRRELPRSRKKDKDKKKVDDKDDTTSPANKKKKFKQAQERARKEEEARFQRRVAEIQAQADARVTQTTAESRLALERAARDREALEQQTRALQIERANLLQKTQQKRKLIPRPSAGDSSTTSSSFRNMDNNNNNSNSLLPIATATIVTSSSPSNRKEFEEKERVADLELERQREELERTNVELQQKLRAAEETATEAAAAALEAARIAREEFLRSRDLDAMLQKEREEVSKRLEEARAQERAALSRKDTLASLKNNVTNSAAAITAVENNNNADTLLLPDHVVDVESIAGTEITNNSAATNTEDVDQQLEQVEEQLAESTARAAVLEAELNELDNPFTILMTSTAFNDATTKAATVTLGNDMKTTTTDSTANNNNNTPRTFEDKLKSRSIDARIAARKSGKDPGINTSPEGNGGDTGTPGAVRTGDDEQNNNNNDDVDDKDDATNSILRALDRGLVLFLLGIAWCVRQLAWACGECAEAARDAHIAAMEEQLRREREKRTENPDSRFRASAIKEGLKVDSNRNSNNNNTNNTVNVTTTNNNQDV